MTVYFIGAGPGAADLITVRGQRLLSRCPVCLYAGSIMPDDLPRQMTVQELRDLIAFLGHRTPQPSKPVQ